MKKHALDVRFVLKSYQRSSLSKKVLL